MKLKVVKRPVRPVKYCRQLFGGLERLLRFSTIYTSIPLLRRLYCVQHSRRRVSALDLCYLNVPCPLCCCPIEGEGNAGRIPEIGANVHVN